MKKKMQQNRQILTLKFNNICCYKKAKKKDIIGISNEADSLAQTKLLNMSR